VHQSSIKFEFEMHQIQSNSIEKCFWKLKEDAQPLSVGISPAGPFPRDGPAATVPSRTQHPRENGLALAHLCWAHGPLAPGLLSLARARGHRQRNLGPGRHFSLPPGPKGAHSRAERPRPSDRDRRLCADLGGTKPPRRSPPKTLAHSLPRSPGAFFFPPEQREWVATGGDRASGATASPLAGARVHRKVSAPPSSGFTVVPRSTARRAAPQRLARPLSMQGTRPLSTRGTRPHGIWSRRRCPGRIDGGRPKGKTGEFPLYRPFSVVS
jgi:hypothetical protein